MTLSQEDAEPYFEKLKILLQKHHTALPNNEIKGILLTAINYCIKQLNQGSEAYVRQAFELFGYGLKHQILLENQQLNQFTYKNILASALRLKEYEWAGDFIRIYTPLLAEEHQ